MNKDQILGRIAQVKGRLRSLTGRIVRNHRLQREGRADEHTGVVQAAFGDAKRATQARIKELLRRIQVQS